MRFKLNQKPDKEEWHIIFAWFPHFTTDGNYIVWLEYCFRKMTSCMYSINYEYKIYDGD